MEPPLKAGSPLNGSTAHGRANGRAHEAECTCPTCGSVISKTVHTAILLQTRQHDAEIEKAVTARFTVQLAEAQKTKRAEIDAAVKAATKTFREGQADVVARAVEVEREKSGKAVAEAVAAARIEHATEKSRLESALAELQHRLAARPAHQIGEPLEAALFETVAEALSGDCCRVSRVPRGRNGPDLVVEFFDQSTCGDPAAIPIGCVAVEAKNVSNWSSRFIPKLKSDARALNAEPILVTNVFPRGFNTARGLGVIDGVVVCGFSSVIPLIELMRKQIIEMHRQKLTGTARSAKGTALLDFVASAGCCGLLNQFVAANDRLLDMEQKEQSAHATVWRRRGDLIRSLQQAHRELVGAFDAILAGKRDTSKEVAI